jgi:hypothetical protein
VGTPYNIRPQPEYSIASWAKHIRKDALWGSFLGNAKNEQDDQISLMLLLKWRSEWELMTWINFVIIRVLRSHEYCPFLLITEEEFVNLLVTNPVSGQDHGTHTISNTAICQEGIARSC